MSEKSQLQSKLTAELNNMQMNVKQLSKEKEDLQKQLKTQLDNQQAIKRDWMSKIQTLKNEMFQKVNDDERQMTMTQQQYK